MHYIEIIVESYNDYASGLHGLIHIRPASNQIYPQNMRVECSKKLSQNYPVGTKFKLFVKKTCRNGGVPFLYSSYKWKYTVSN